MQARSTTMPSKAARPYAAKRLQSRSVNCGTNTCGRDIGDSELKNRILRKSHIARALSAGELECSAERAEPLGHVAPADFRVAQRDHVDRNAGDRRAGSHRDATKPPAHPPS